MAARLFIGKLAEDTKQAQLEEAFGKYGKVERVDMKAGFAFLIYEEVSSVKAAVSAMNGYEINGSRIVCDFARNIRDHNGGPGPNPRSENRLSIIDIDPGTSWQDLKDWARSAGNVSFANVFTKNGDKVGVVEYESAGDVEKALKILQQTPLRGGKFHIVRRERASDCPDEGRGGGGGYSRSYQDRGGYNDRGGHSDSLRDSRYFDDERSGGYARGGGGGGYESSGRAAVGDHRSAPAYSSRGYSDDRRAPPADPYYRERPPARSRSRERERDRSRDRAYPPSSSYDRPSADYGGSSGYYPPVRGGYTDSRGYDRAGGGGAGGGRDQGSSSSSRGGAYDSRSGGYDAPPPSRGGGGGGYDPRGDRGDRGAPPAYDAPARRGGYDGDRR